MRRGGFLAWLALAVAACGTSSADDAAPDASPNHDAGADAVVDAAPDATTDPDAGVEAGADADAGATCPIVYVSPTGDDAQTGCDPSAPKATVASGIAAVENAGTTSEVHVCRGTYTEVDLTIEFPITLRGGYDCTSWTRVPNFGWQGFDATGHAVPFDATNETTIIGATADPALTVTGTIITSAVTIEGLTIRGLATGGFGVVVDNGASPTFSDDHLVAVASIESRGIAAIWIEDTAAPEVSHCIAESSAPSDATSVSAIAVWIEGNSFGGPLPKIHDNEITATSNADRSTATALQISHDGSFTGDAAIARNAIFFTGIGSDLVSSATGINAGGPIDILDNGIYGSSVGCDDGCALIAIALGSGLVEAPLSHVSRNRISVTDASSSPLPPGLSALSLTGESVVVADNLILIDAATGSTDGVFTLFEPGDLHIEHNTVVVNDAAGIDAITSQFVSNGVTIDDNLLVGVGRGYVGVAQCGERLPETFNDNALVGPAVSPGALNVPVDHDGCSDGPAEELTTIRAFEGAMSGPSSTASGNVVLASADLFAETPTLATLIAGGWQLAATVPCAIAQGGGAPLTLVPTDYAGAMRTNAVSIGAFEDDAACQ